MTAATVHLALRRSDALGFWPRLFSSLTRWRLHTRYPHAGIVAGGLLYHSTFFGGLVKERVQLGDDWDLVPLPGVEPDDVEAWFDHLEGARYDWFSLLAFVLPWRISKRSWMYCYEWCFLVMTGRMPSGRITAELLLSIAIKMGAQNENAP